MDLPSMVLAGILAALIAAALAAWRSFRVQIRRMADWLRRLQSGETAPSVSLPRFGMLTPIAHEAATLVRRLAEASEAAEQEARLRRLGDAIWTGEKLRDLAKSALSGRTLIVVANREPYRHVHKGRGIVCEMPASGLVTGVEPLLRACGGTWIAHGDGDADRETVDRRDHVQVPPDAPQYVLRRLWLSAEEQKGYYSGFANEGLWPLCHIAHTRPLFRPRDWEFYKSVNERFARAALEEIEGEEEPFLLIQDYHFTLLPRLIKQRRPDARVALFWHIPWPNPEAFGICPWQNELLEGMLGADLIGFHTPWYCNNFLETVDRALESRIDRERSLVTRRRAATQVRAFPISVAFHGGRADAQEDPAVERARILKAHGIDAASIAVGVDRLDYTKGILERFRGVERFLELFPGYRGHFTLFQIGAPSRSDILRYQNLSTEIETEAKRINERFPSRSAPPIVLLRRNHSHEEIEHYYRAADVCLVTSLHDGMNLVAKEFVSARDDESGVLVLSRFTGAAHELADALLINPYDVDAVALSIRAALEMPDEEKTLRMNRLRRTVQENNVYKWAAGLITELAAIRRDEHQRRRHGRAVEHAQAGL